MKIYLDLVIITNFIIDFILLYGTSKILKKYVTLKRLLLGSLTGSLSVIILFIKLNTLNLTILKLLLSTLIISVTFGLKDIKKNLIYFYALSIILGGTLYLFDITKIKNNKFFISNPYIFNFILLIIITPIIIYKYIKEFKLTNSEISHKYLIEIKINNHKYTLEAILDTGNRLTDPYKKRPIILIDKKINYSNKKTIYVPYKALNTEGVIKCILPDKVIINNKEFNNCLIGLSNDKFSLNGVSCILPNKFKEDL